MKVKTRFAPSPTGLMHIGNVRTALFSWLLAKKSSGIFLLRIEDTDQERSTVPYTQAIQQDLQWLDIAWQEGPGQGSEEQLYYQSQRTAIYADYYAQLLHKGYAYPCFCTEEQLELTRKLQRATGQPPRYPGTCAYLTPEEIQQKKVQGLAPALRFRVPKDNKIEFEDVVRGKQVYESNDLGDFIIRKTDGSASFMFCNAVDDALMQVTQVLRGEDHLTNTPRQLLILQVLGLQAPHYGHISIILGADGAPLSKRNGSKSIGELRDAGYLPLAVANYLARLGHHCPNNELLSLEQLAEEFAIERLVKSPAKYDEIQLQHWQKAALLKLDNETLWQWMQAAVKDKVPVAAQATFIAAVRDNIETPKDAVFWAERLFADKLMYSAAAVAVFQTAGPAFFQQCLLALEQVGSQLDSYVNIVKNLTGVAGKSLFQPLRIALTMESHGPELKHIITLLGIKGMQQRFEQVLELLTNNKEA